MKKTAIGIIVLAVLVFGAILVIAQKGGRGGDRGFGPGGHGRGGMMLRGLDLTDEQKTQAQQIREAAKTKLQPVFESLKANHEKMDAATANGAFDEAQVTALANEKASLQAQVFVENARERSQVFAILTDEQKAKAAEMRENMKGRFEGRRGHGKQRKDGSE